MTKWHGGKGSKQRPTDKKKFDDNWDRIFNKKADTDLDGGVPYKKSEKKLKIISKNS